MGRDVNDALLDGGKGAVGDHFDVAEPYKRKPNGHARKANGHANGHANGKAGHHTNTDTQADAQPNATESERQVAVTIDHFYAYLPEKNKFIFTPTGDLWPIESVDMVLGPVTQEKEYKGRGRRTIKASTWLARHRAVMQMTWWPGQPQIMEDVLVVEGGLIPWPGARIYNLYRPPNIKLGDPKTAEKWVNHLKRVYPQNWEHTLKWKAHRVQRPWEKCNHAVVLTGPQGIGKDTLLEPVVRAVGPWNVQEIGPNRLMGEFNPYA